MSPKKITGVLLAAGMGLRLGDITKEKPKALVEVAGKPLCFYALRFLELCGVNEIIVVGGFGIEELKKIIGQFKNNVPLTILENKNFKQGNLFSIKTALPSISNSFLMVNTDHIYKISIAEVVKKEMNDITAFVDFDRMLGSDDMKVKLENARVCEMSKTLEKFDCGYVGMTYVDETRLELYKQAVSRTSEIRGEKAVVEQVLVQLKDMNHAPRIGDISGHGWLEVDFPEERQKAEVAVTSNPLLYGLL